MRMSSRLPGRTGLSPDGSNGGGATEVTRVSRFASAEGAAAGVCIPSRAARKKSERDARAGVAGVWAGNRGDGTGGRIALMPTGLTKTVGNGLTAGEPDDQRG